MRSLQRRIVFRGWAEELWPVRKEHILKYIRVYGVLGMSRGQGSTSARVGGV